MGVPLWEGRANTSCLTCNHSITSLPNTRPPQPRYGIEGKPVYTDAKLFNQRQGEIDTEATLKQSTFPVPPAELIQAAKDLLAGCVLPLSLLSVSLSPCTLPQLLFLPTSLLCSSSMPIALLSLPVNHLPFHFSPSLAFTLNPYLQIFLPSSQ